MNRQPLQLLAAIALVSAAGIQAQTPPPAGAEPEAPPAQKAVPRVTFDVTLGEGQAGGLATGSAGDFEYQEGQYLIATGGVDFKYRGLRLQAQRARVDIATSLLSAEGDVILDDGPQRLIGQTLEYDLNTRTGKVTEATAYVENEYYFSGSQIAKTGVDTFTVDDGVLTSCSQDVPSWSIHLSHASVTLEEYARIKNARLKFKKVPVLYAPYLVWPANTDRSSGLLVPRPGYSERRGAELSLAYFKTLGRSADTTFVLDLSSDEYFGIGNETRYRPSEDTDGTFKLYALFEPEDAQLFNDFFETRAPGDTRWKVEWLHETRNLWGGFRGVVNLQQYSDFDYLQDYERNANQQRRSFIYSNAFLTRNFHQQSLNIMVDQRERILSNANVDRRRQLPEIEYNLRPTKLGPTPVYVSLESSMHYFSVEQNTFSEEYGRIDLSPTFSIPLSTLSWLSAKADLGGRATFYTDSVVGGQFSGEYLTRVLPQAGLEVIGPSFARIFGRESGGKLKHIIEPRLTYAFVDSFDEQDEIFLFDQLDSLRPVNGLLFSLVNRLMSKPPGDGGSAFEIASLTLGQGLSLDDTQPGQISRDRTRQRNAGPLLLNLRVNPSREVSVKADLTYNTLFSQLQSLQFSGQTRLGRHDFGLSWFTNWDPESGDKRSDQARFSTRLALLPDKLSVQANLSYDVLQSQLLQQRYFLDWRSQCYSWQLEVRESRYRDITDRDFRFSFTLKNVGTFLDLNDSF